MSDEFQLPEIAPGKYIPLRPDAPHHRAYYPNPLPPRIELGVDLIEKLADAMLALGRLDGLGSEVSNPGAVFSSFVYKEAEQSSQVEGTKVTVSDIYQYDLSGNRVVPDDSDSSERDIREARNYVSALHEGLSYFQTAGRSRDTVTIELIKSLHETLMEKGRSDEDDPLPGEFRPGLAYIEENNEAWKDPVRFVPPKPNMAEGRMHDLEEYIQSGGQYPDLVDIGLIHYQFETIHPFKDGNGRVGRLLVVLLLHCSDLLVNPLLYPSSYIQRHRSEYADRLLEVSEAGAWDEWLDFFLTAMKQQADEAFVRAKLLLERRREYMDRYEDEAKSVRRLSEAIFEQPYLTVREAEDLIDMSYQSANTAVDRLEADGVLEEITGNQKNRVFRAAEVMDIVERAASDVPDSDDIIATDPGAGSPVERR